MPTFQELKARYMDVGSSGSFGSTPPSIPISTNNKVTTFIHGSRYFPALKAEINRLGSGDTSGQFIYLMGWWFDINFSLDGSGAAAKLSDLLKAKSAAGVDVRLLGWTMAPEILQDARVQGSGDASVQSMLALNNETVEFIQVLRAETTLAEKAVVNILAHPAGAVHMKFALVGDNSKTVGFTGGIDLQSARHETWWHDVAAKVEGPVVQSMFGNFLEQWNEIKGRSPVRLTIRGGRVSGGTFVPKTPITANSHTTAMPTLASRTLTLPNTGQMHVQNLTTVPRMNFSVAHSALSMPTNQTISYAPNGRFDARNAWIRALQGAQTYIYIEDQSFTAEELFDTINAQLKAQSALKLILVIGGPDPTAPGGSSKDFQIAINDHLLNGLSAAQRDRVGIFRRTDSILVHPKTTLIDDNWAMVGSANMMRRSLYTDLEHSVAFMDENSNTGVVDYRRVLWGTHLGSSSATLSTALDAWFNIAVGASLGNVQRVRLPLPAASRSAIEQTIYDELTEPDSRQSWGGIALIRVLSGAGSGSGS